MLAADRSRLELLARLGYAARGVVNLLIGGLALLAAFGRGGGATGSKGALQTLLLQPLGHVLLAIVALGLFGFALWRAFQSLLDADGHGHAPKALVIRFGQIVSAAVYVGLGVFAISLLLGWAAGGGGEESAHDWTGWLLTKPMGRWLVGAVGVAIVGSGLGMARKAWSGSFARHLACEGATATWVLNLGRLGYAARSVVFLVIGGFLLLAAYHAAPDEAHGLGGALLALQEQPFGRALFGLVAFGLAAFGIFEFAEARYRRIDMSDGRKALDAASARLA
ncbi:MAG: hypothetical protein BGO51_09470 [Rhodospirillales bacterium 69-11]|nr:DUF1206 domain-containing protein [Rhodospirillales bacterium]MBN8926342.1 DUF1206 domain-containing protein [Rhodospirillales bacterium]OJW26112.1 MAG: hypothetical protein BGO51_09470 [Rhodospirillales bacterium 69-11]